MADLVTHLASALIPGVGFKRPEHGILLAFGTALPDLAGRAPGIVTEILDAAGTPAPDGLSAPFGVFHQPIGGMLTALALAFLFPARERPKVAGLVALGVLLHLALDVLQDHHGHGYYLLSPFHFGRYEIGCIGSEATVAWAPWLALLTVVVWGIRVVVTIRRRRRDRVPPPG